MTQARELACSSSSCSLAQGLFELLRAWQPLLRATRASNVAAMMWHEFACDQNEKVILIDDAKLRVTCARHSALAG
ncbi:MAG: hypothetical protein ACM3PU_11025 [Gemmatimonadota bacterium]